MAPGGVLLSLPLIAYYDPIRQSRGHAVTSRQRRLYPAPSLCGHASATHETFPTFTAALSARAVDHTPVGPRNPSRCPCVTRYQASSSCDRVATHDTRLCQQYSTGSSISALHRSLHATARAFASPSGLAMRQMESRVFHLSLLRTLSSPLLASGRRRPALGTRLDGRTGNLPSSGLTPDKSQQLVRLQHNSKLRTTSSSARCERRSGTRSGPC